MSNDLPERDDDALVDETSAQLRVYVRQHPRAADTVEGIAMWWLPEGGAGIEPAVLERALQRLADEAQLARRTLPSGRVLWYVPTPQQPG